MKLAFFTSVAVSALLAPCSAFTPVNAAFLHKSTAVQGAVSSQWTMMPDEPIPEVGFAMASTCHFGFRDRIVSQYCRAVFPM